MVLTERNIIMAAMAVAGIRHRVGLLLAKNPTLICGQPITWLVHFPE